MEVKYTKDVEHIRSLFERALALSLKLRPAKLLFKKYLDFETAHGTSKSQAYVRNKAQKFVEVYVKTHGKSAEELEREEENEKDDDH